MNEQSDRYHGKKSFVTFLLIAANVVIYMILEWIGDTENVLFLQRFGAMDPESVYQDGEVWRLLSASFLHFGFEHLFNNMVMLACAGPVLERAVGHLRFLLLYLLAAFGGSGLSCLMMYVRKDFAVSAGASGAIFGVVGGLFWVVIANRGFYEGISAKRMLLMIVLCMGVGIGTSEVDNWGHLGGLAAGFLACICFYSRRGKKIDFTSKNQYT